MHEAKHARAFDVVVQNPHVSAPTLLRLVRRNRAWIFETTRNPGLSYV